MLQINLYTWSGWLAYTVHMQGVVNEHISSFRGEKPSTWVKKLQKAARYWWKNCSTDHLLEVAPKTILEKAAEEATSTLLIGGTWDGSGNLWTALPWWSAPHFVETETWEGAAPLSSWLRHSTVIRTKVTQPSAVDIAHCATSSDFSLIKIIWTHKSISKNFDQDKTANHYTFTQSLKCWLQITSISSL